MKLCYNLFIVKALICKTLDICTLLGYYVAYSGNSLQTFRDNLWVQSSRIKKFKKKFLRGRSLKSRTVKQLLRHSVTGTTCIIFTTVKLQVSYLFVCYYNRYCFSSSHVQQSTQQWHIAISITNNQEILKLLLQKTKSKSILEKQLHCRRRHGRILLT